MAKKRSEATKEKTKNTKKTSSTSRVDVNIKSNAITAKNSRSSTTRVRSAKPALKSTDAPSKRKPANRDDSKNATNKKGSSQRGKKRNSSLQESSESPSKKSKLESSSKAQTQKLGTLKDDKSCSLRQQRKTAALSKQASKEEKHAADQIKTGSAGIQEVTTGKGKQRKQSPLKHKHVPTPENVESSPRKDKVVGKRLKLDLVENGEEENMMDKNAREGLGSSDESSDDEGVVWEDVDEANVVDHGMENEGASTSHQHHSPSKKSVEISITVPGTNKRKKGRSQEDVMKYVKRAVNRFRKDVFTRVHKVHLLTLVAHGSFRNGVCNDPLLQAVLLSHVPGDFISGNKRKWDIVRLTNFLKWFQSEFSSTDDASTGDKETDKQIDKFQNLSEVFVTILRALGFLTRLVYSLQPMSAKGAEVDSKASPKNAKKKSPKASKTAPKNTPEDSAKKLTRPRKQKEAIKPKNIKTENKFKTTAANASVVSHSRSKSDSRSDSNKTQAEKCLKKESGKLLNSAKSAAKTRSKNSQVSKTVTEEMDRASSSNNPVKKNVKKRPLRKRSRVDYSLCGSENGNDADEEWNEQSSDSEELEDMDNSRENSTKKDKTPLARKKVSSANSDSGTPNGSSSFSFVDLVGDDSDFEVTSKPLVKRKVSTGSLERKRKVAKIISSDDSDESVKCLGNVYNEKDINWWSEVYLPLDKKWICVHLESSGVNHPELCEKQATQPLVYVVSFDNKNAVKDVTNRYASSLNSKTRKLRIDSDWWEDTLQPYKSRNKKMDQMEDLHLEDQLLEKPLPTSITEFKNHPLYVLKRHLLKFEAIYPETAAILGYCRSEAVYSRDCLQMLHTREKWLNEALVVKQGEKPYKIVKGRPKRNQPIHERDSVTIDLFGRWQTERYKPPPAKDGKVPRNEYGNVELFLPCMLPPGTKHIQINGIQRVAKKLGIDSAQAVVGFDFHCGFSHPVLDGVVVCEEFEQVLLDAWQEEEEQAEKRKAEKREKRMLANWRLLTRSLLIRERLKKRYDKEEVSIAEASSSALGDDAVTDTSISWPLNRQEGKASVAGEGHCHVFPESGHRQDPVTGEWSKTCSCGLTLPFEKM